MKSKLFITLLIAGILIIIIWAGTLIINENLSNYAFATNCTLSLIIGRLLANKLTD